MTHGAIYDLAPYIRFVFHVHSPLIWQRAKALQLPMTKADVGYGTTQMAHEVSRLCRETQLLERPVFGMAGHEDGIIAFGRTAEEAGSMLLSVHASAQILLFRENKSLCR